VRDYILSEIRRLAAENGGTPPGREVFAKVTGITPGKWTGVYWLRWGDALAEAGFSPNEMVRKRDSREILERVASLTRTLGRLPTGAEIKMQRRVDPEFPAHSTVGNHYHTNADLASALRELAASDTSWADLGDLLPEPSTLPARKGVNRQEGIVYLLKSGKHYKIGRSDDIERRFREVRIALPESVSLIHSIRTDDPSGIEAYWHRRFADKRANGEWFALTGDDVRAFRKRSFQ